MHNAFGHTPKENTAETGTAVGAYDDQVCGPTPGFFDDYIGDAFSISVEQSFLHRDTRLPDHFFGLRQYFFTAASHYFLKLSIVEINFTIRKKDYLDNMQQFQLCTLPNLSGEAKRFFKRALRGRTPVTGHQDALIHRHPESSLDANFRTEENHPPRQPCLFRSVGDKVHVLVCSRGLFRHAPHGSGPY